MEEILASIRRIIADDDAGKSAKPPEPPAPKPAVAAVPNRPAPASAPPPRPVTPPPRPVPAAAAISPQPDTEPVKADLAPAPKAAPRPEPPKAEPPRFEMPKAEPPKAEPPAVDVLDLTEAMTASAPGPSFRTIDGASDVVFTDRASETPAEPPTRPAPPPAFDRGLISSATMAAVDGAFNSLANTVLGNNARTLEDLVKEMLRPMLKAWLDDNLPGMVERIVRAEIERVSRGR
jgi:hypothetical protein